MVAVAGDQETREEGTEDKGNHDTSDEECVVDAVVGLVEFRWPPYSFRRQKIKKFVLQLNPF